MSSTWISSTPSLRVSPQLPSPPAYKILNTRATITVKMQVRACLSSTHNAERAFGLLTGKAESSQWLGKLSFTQLHQVSTAFPGRTAQPLSHHLLCLGGYSSRHPQSSLTLPCLCLHAPFPLRTTLSRTAPSQPPQGPFFGLFSSLHFSWSNICLFKYFSSLFSVSLLDVSTRRAGIFLGIVHCCISSILGSVS